MREARKVQKSVNKEEPKALRVGFQEAPVEINFAKHLPPLFLRMRELLGLRKREHIKRFRMLREMRLTEALHRGISEQEKPKLRMRHLEFCETNIRDTAEFTLRSNLCRILFYGHYEESFFFTSSLTSFPSALPFVSFETSRITAP